MRERGRECTSTYTHSRIETTTETDTDATSERVDTDVTYNNTYELTVHSI
jgi:hypothetical protein